MENLRSISSSSGNSSSTSNSTIKRNHVGSLQNWEKVRRANIKSTRERNIRSVSHGEQFNSAPVLADFRKFIFVLNKWFHFYVCHKRELANEITGIFTCIVSTWGTLRHWYSAGGRSHWIEHTEPGFSYFAVLRFMSKLSFYISNSILHHAVICQASWVSTKGSNWILQLALSVCRLFWFLTSLQE